MAVSKIGANKKYEGLNLVFVNHREEDKIHPLTTIEIAKHKKGSRTKIYLKIHAITQKKDDCFQLTEDTIVP
jgi:hypothetical protein